MEAKRAGEPLVINGPDWGLPNESLEEWILEPGSARCGSSRRRSDILVGMAAKKGYWLVKSEPFKYSWEQFVKDGETTWDGVRNYLARNNLKAMKKGDEVLFYHSNEGLAVVGIAKVSKEAFQDPSTDDERWVAVSLKPAKALKTPVTLDEIKKDKKLQDMMLVRQGRLSVAAVTEDEFHTIVDRGGKKS